MPPRPTPSRRAVLGALPLGLLALTTGCDDDSSSAPEGSRDPDQGLLDSVRTATRDLRANVDAASAMTTRAGTVSALTALSACLSAHLDEIDPDDETSPESSASTSEASPGATEQQEPAPGTDVSVRSVVLAARSHVTLLVDAASRAESGAFARLLASAAAGVGQHLVPLEGRNRASGDATATSEEDPA